MRLTSFEVQGFKNLAAPVKLEELGPINVIHGENNVGKSNLLRAIEVFFRLLGAVRGDGWLLDDDDFELSEGELNHKGIRLIDLFNYAVPRPIHLAASLTIEEAELTRAGLQPRLDCNQVSIALSLTSLQGAVKLEVASFQFADGMTAWDAAGSPEQADFVLGFIRFLTARFLGPRGLPHVDVDRRVDKAVDALYDASASQDRKQAMQWSRFAEVMEPFIDILGDGRFIAVLPRESPHARLLYETPTMRIPLHALGSGVQQIVALFGHVLTCGASIVSVEEPELNLRWTLQERVRDALRDLVGKEGAPSQLFLTSHSGAFESGSHFYLMQMPPGVDGPIVERRPISDVPIVVGGAAPEVVTNAPRAPAHVSGEGTLRLPDRIRKAVRVEHGGGVSFVDKGDGVVEMMSDDTFLRRAGLDDDDT